ncbi:Serine/threonine-protein kinase Nek6 [Perkinsus olseni]|uniref:non-specific serine/threonine protein kinase n=1 Tax=Perkinsus olseni TaxID=32597 RepID=A0A7J6MA70_PEROL|nr:Serine/threonine-protein kinase Nek6 [Perkinsus olseni]
MSEGLPEIPSFGAEPRCTGPDAASSTSTADLVPHHLTTLSATQSASQLYPISADTAHAADMMNDDGSFGQQEKSPPDLLEAISSGNDPTAGPSSSASANGDGENPVFMSMMGAAMAAAQLQNMNQQIQMQQYMLLQQQQALIAHAQMKRGTPTPTSGGVPPPPGSPLDGTESHISSPTSEAPPPPTAGMSGQLTAALISAGAHSPGSSVHSDETKTLDLGVTTPKVETSPGSSVNSNYHMTESDVGTLPLVAVTDDCCTLDGDSGDMKYGELTLDVGPEQGPAAGGQQTGMPGYDTQAWQQFQQLQYNQWSYAAAMSNPWYSQGYAGSRGYAGQGGHDMMRGDTVRNGSAAAAEAVAGIKRRKKPYAAPKGVWRNNGGYNATIYVNKKRIYGPVRRNLADAVSDRRVMEDSVDSARAKVERMIEEQHKVFESDQARESFIAEESHTMIREVVAKLRAERGTHNSANSGPSDPRPSVQSSLASQQSRRPGVVPSLAQAVYGTAAAAAARPGNMMPFMMPYPSAVWPRSMSASSSSSPPLPRARKRERSVPKEDSKGTAAGVKLDTMPTTTKLAHSVLFGGEGSLPTTDIEIPADLPGANESFISDPKRARTSTAATTTTSSSSSSSSYVPLSPLFNPGSPPLSSRLFSSALPKYLRSPAFPATQLTPSRGAPPFGPNGVQGPIMDDDIQLEDSAIESGAAGLYGKGMSTSFGGGGADGDAYKITRVLGQGAYGQVFVVESSLDKKLYCLKRVGLREVDHCQREQVKQEVHLLETLKGHPNIVCHKESFVTPDDAICIVMEYCSSGDLGAHIQSLWGGGSPPTGLEDLAVDWLIQMCFALQALHSRRVLHRDVKTENIFLMRPSAPGQGSLVLKLGDFGVSKMLGSPSSDPLLSRAALATTMIGTPVYMSPEMYKGKSYSFESDVWGLGCVLYEALHGRYAFEADSLQGLALKIMQGHYGRMTCSEGMQELVSLMLCESPKNRPSLQAILALPIVRTRIIPTLKGVCSCVESHAGARAAQEAYETLLAQLDSMGLGRIVEPEASLPSTRAAELRRPAEKEKMRTERELVEDLQEKLRTTATGRLSRGVSARLRGARSESRDRGGAYEPVPYRPGRGDSRTGGQDVAGLTYLLEYEHISKENLANPFKPVRPPVVNSPQGSKKVRPLPASPSSTGRVDPAAASRHEKPSMHDLGMVHQSSSFTARCGRPAAPDARPPSEVPIEAMNLERSTPAGPVRRPRGHEAVPMLPRSRLRAASVDPLPSGSSPNRWGARAGEQPRLRPLDERERTPVEEDERRRREINSILRKVHRRRMALRKQNMEIRMHQYSLGYEESPADFITGGMAHPRGEFESSRVRATEEG